MAKRVVYPPPIAAGQRRRRSLRAHLRRLLWREDGIAAVESALVLPIMIFFIFASIEAYQYFRVLGIMHRAAFSVADAVAMQPRLHEAGPCQLTDHLCTYGTVMNDLMRPLDYAKDGHMAIGVYATETREDGMPAWISTPEWSKNCTGGGVCTDTALLNDIPVGMPAPKLNDSVLAVKVFQTYEPFIISAGFWANLGGKVDLSVMAFTRTRFDDLRTLQP